LSLLQIKSNQDMTAESLAKHQDSQQQQKPIISQLSAYVLSAYEDAELFRSTTNVTQRLLICKRQNAGRYTKEKLDAIQRSGGSRLYANVTQVKTQAAEAWMGDVFTPASDKPWDVVPTPIPDLPEDVKRGIVEQTVREFQAMGAPAPEDVTNYAESLYDKIMSETYEEARERADRMSQKMEDQCAEGDFNLAFTEFISYLTVYPSAILKGPVIRHRKKLKWVTDEVGNTSCEVVTEAVPTFEAIDPFWFYPGPNSRRVQDTYICEITHWDSKALSEMRGVEGYKNEAINDVLANYPRGYRVGHGVYQDGESEHETLDERELLYHDTYSHGTLQSIEFWGSVPGSLLQEWGMKGIDDPFRYYEVNAVLIGNYIVKAVLNPDPLDRRPYFVCSWFHNPSSIWGIRSLPEQMTHCQDALNATQRNLINNLSIASGPQVKLDIDALPPEEVAGVNNMFPWKVWKYHGKQTNNSNPVDFFQPQSNASELIAVSEFFFTQADELTMIPRYVYGNQDVGGAAETATGLGMLMKSASRGIKRVIKNVDQYVLRLLMERLYTWNMRYLPDDQYALMKGDAQIIPRGALAILVKEQTQLRRQEFLQMTANPIDMEIIGMEGRATLLREVAKGLDIAVDKLVPSEQDLRQRTRQSLEQQTPNPNDIVNPNLVKGVESEMQGTQQQAQAGAQGVQA